jgi:hypothetical protein
MPEPVDVITLRSSDGSEEAFCADCRATWSERHWCTPMLRRDLARIEAKLDRLMQALSAGAVGDWR